MQVKEIQYKTRPFDCWQKAKELRVNNYRSVMNARNEGKMLTTGGMEGPTELVYAFGDFVHLAEEPYGASCATMPEFSQACLQACESRGYARDLCGYVREYLGSVFLNRFAFGGEFPKPDFSLQTHACDSHAKWMQAATEIKGVPFFCVDTPLAPIGLREENKIKYLSDQFYEAIEWLKKVTGRDFDDERFVKAVENSFEASKLWAEVCNYNKHIPAPLDQKSIFTFYVPILQDHFSDEIVSFYRTLRDEVKWRVENDIAALATERCRFIDDSPPPWYFLEIYRYLQEYGAVSVGSTYTYGLCGAWEDQTDGTIGPKKTPKEKGIVLQTRDDYIQALAQWTLDRLFYFQSMCVPSDKSRMMLRIVKEFHLDAVIFHLNRGCEGLAFGQKENRLYLSENGVPTLTYEGNNADRRDFDEKGTLRRIDTFMESLGLKKLGLI